MPKGTPNGRVGGVGRRGCRINFLIKVSKGEAVVNQCATVYRSCVHVWNGIRGWALVTGCYIYASYLFGSTIKASIRDINCG